MTKYGKTPHGKRMVRCGCNDSFDALDDGTECFEDGQAAEQCPGCGYFPWYNIEPLLGGSNREPKK